MLARPAMNMLDLLEGGPLRLLSIGGLTKHDAATARAPLTKEQVEQWANDHGDWHKPDDS